MGLLVTFLQGKLAELYVKFKKIEEIIDIYEDTCGKVDERFQSAYDELLSLTKKLYTEDKQPCLCRQHKNRNKLPAEEVEKCWQKLVYLMFLEIAFLDIKLVLVNKKRLNDERCRLNFYVVP